VFSDSYYAIASVVLLTLIFNDDIFGEVSYLNEF